MLAIIDKSIPPAQEPIQEPVVKHVRFRRVPQYIRFNNEHPRVIITMQPVYQDPKLSPRTLAKIAIFEENDTLAKFILEQGAK